MSKEIAISSYPNLSRKNYIINGNFDIWQRGASFSATTINQHLADRWRSRQGGSTTAASQQEFTVGQTDVPNNPRYFHRSVVASSVGDGNLATLHQRIEDVTKLAGKTVTLSFWARTTGSPKEIAVEFAQVFGTGGSPSAHVFGIGVTTVPLTTAWTKHVVTVELPSIAGKTLGTDIDESSFTDINFWFDAGSDYNARTNSLGQQSGTFDISQVQLEEGSVETDFEHRSIGEELALCQRYYQILRIILTAQSDTQILRSRFVTSDNYMRTIPTVIDSNESTTATYSVVTFPVSAGSRSCGRSIVIFQLTANSNNTSNTIYLDAEL